ncbi:MAG TPA: GNAT family N-acetyltransferase [Gaiellaceae bacterium]
MRWQPGETIVRRELWRGRPWMGTPVLVVEDEPELLVTYLPRGARFEFPDGDWPGDGRHPWHGRGAWEGHGVLMLHRPGDRYSVWHFWDGHRRRFAGWYVNLQEPFRRTPIGFDTQDLELDIWIPAAGGGWEFKDWELVDERVADGRFTASEAEGIRETGRRLAAQLDAGERWWSDGWAGWRPDRSWTATPLPPGWEKMPAEPLTTGRLLLRPVTEDDREWLVALYLSIGDTPERSERELDDAIERWRSLGFGHHAATLRDTGAPAGVIELTPVAPGGRGDEVEIGWAVRAELRGRGLASEAAAAVIAHELGRGERGCVVADIRPDNAASVRVAEKVGMRRRGPGRSRSGDAVDVWERCGS